MLASTSKYGKTLQSISKFSDGALDGALDETALLSRWPVPQGALDEVASFQKGRRVALSHQKKAKHRQQQQQQQLVHQNLIIADQSRNTLLLSFHLMNCNIHN